MTASHAIFPFASVCKATTWHWIPIQVSDVLCLGHAYPEPLGIYRILILHFHMFYRSSTEVLQIKMLSKSIFSHTPVACWCVLPAFPISKGYLTAGISLGSLVDLKESSESQLFLRLVVSVLLTYVKWSCDEPIWAESEPVAGPCVFQEKHHHRQSPRGFAVPSLQAATWQDLPGYMRLL